MKKIILLLAFVCILCTSCVRVVTSSYKEVWHGHITQMDSLGRLDIINNEGITQTWYVGDIYDDILCPMDNGPLSRFAVGDEVFIHAKDGNIQASKVSIKHAKSINSKLFDVYAENAIFPWIILISFIVAGIALFFLVYEEGYNVAVFITIVCIMVAFFHPLVTMPKLYYIDEGVVTSITKNYVTLDNQKKFAVYTLESLSDKDKKINIGDTVYAYKYSEYEEKSGTTFLATDKLTHATIRTLQIYPERSLYNFIAIAIGLVLTISVYKILEVVQKKFFSKTELEET